MKIILVLSEPTRLTNTLSLEFGSMYGFASSSVDQTTWCVTLSMAYIQTHLYELSTRWASMYILVSVMKGSSNTRRPSVFHNNRSEVGVDLVRNHSATTRTNNRLTAMAITTRKRLILHHPFILSPFGSTNTSAATSAATRSPNTSASSGVPSSANSSGR